MTLDDLRALEAAATPGPWEAMDSPGHWQLFASRTPDAHGYQVIKAPKSGTPYAEYWPTPADSAYIVAALNALPALLAIAAALPEDPTYTGRDCDDKTCFWCGADWWIEREEPQHAPSCRWLAASTALATLEDR